MYNNLRHYFLEALNLKKGKKAGKENMKCFSYFSRRCASFSLYSQIRRRHAPLVRFNRIGRENNRINNINNGPSPENNRGG